MCFKKRISKNSQEFFHIKYSNKNNNCDINISIPSHTNIMMDKNSQSYISEIASNKNKIYTPSSNFCNNIIKSYNYSLKKDLNEHSYTNSSISSNLNSNIINYQLKKEKHKKKINSKKNYNKRKTSMRDDFDFDILLNRIKQVVSNENNIKRNTSYSDEKYNCNFPCYYNNNKENIDEEKLLLKVKKALTRNPKNINTSCHYQNQISYSNCKYNCNTLNKNNDFNNNYSKILLDSISEIPSFDENTSNKSIISMINKKSKNKNHHLNPPKSNQNYAYIFSFQHHCPNINQNNNDPNKNIKNSVVNEKNNIINNLNGLINNNKNNYIDMNSGDRTSFDFVKSTNSINKNKYKSNNIDDTFKIDGALKDKNDIYLDIPCSNYNTLDNKSTVKDLSVIDSFSINNIPKIEYNTFIDNTDETMFDKLFVPIIEKYINPTQASGLDINNNNNNPINNTNYNNNNQMNNKNKKLTFSDFSYDSKNYLMNYGLMNKR
ncbi:hypothetical protein BCR36DRAFT_410419 [Piromyces finnis]|uniref:Uncharacterized protein n=1 Tax=Piromyces finnis TaxID=1754191 RepID=A0A1Y1VH81_9FUNG|nr:hypothetical protein BCR36DRAFT_410419 [Piromyces finnis]|eukprot:ORX55500.1 hypothetical protein BCR36DRAFT_410419 [Piromyces finnis]